MHEGGGDDDHDDDTKYNAKVIRVLVVWWWKIWDYRIIGFTTSIHTSNTNFCLIHLTTSGYLHSLSAIYLIHVCKSISGRRLCVIIIYWLYIDYSRSIYPTPRESRLQFQSVLHVIYYEFHIVSKYICSEMCTQYNDGLRIYLVISVLFGGRGRSWTAAVIKMMMMNTF